MLRLYVISLVAAFCLNATVSADESPAIKSLDTGLKENVARDVGSFAPSQTLRGKVVHDEAGLPVGKIDDMIIDPYTGMASSLIVIPGPAVGPGYRMLIPFNLVTPIRMLQVRARADLDQIRGGPSIGKGDNARPYRRQLARAPFDYYDIDPIWKPSPLTRDRKLNEDDRFLYINSVRGSSVESGNGKTLGQIDDIAISLDNGKIAYVVLKVPRSDGNSEVKQEFDRYPIPLGAFVAQPSDATWVIELPEKLIAEMEPIQHDRWPAEVSLGWEVYVRERYGDGMLNGIQRDLSE